MRYGTLGIIAELHLLFSSMQSIGVLMAQYIYTMNNVSKLVPPKREILKKY
ncbi:ABC transporter, ATP-binding protein [Psychrobacter sp. JCM 18901]|nr:ABC transporter, ATP-binding protein [Psychrobacter sp. JCM 18901]